MNTRQPSPKAQFSALLSRFSPESIALGKKCLAKLGRAIPGATQIVYEYKHSVVVSISPSDKGYEGILALSIYPREVRLYFQGGKALPDPEGLLQGAAKVRFVVIEKASNLDKKEIQALLKAAIKLSDVAIPRTRESRMIIQSVQNDKKKKKKKTSARA